MYVLESVTKGNTSTVTDIAVYEGDKTKLSLMAMIAGLLRITKPVKVNIYTSSAVINGAIRNKWLNKWEDNGWKTNKSEAIKHAGLWKYVSKIVNEKQLILIAGDAANTYQNWMKDQLKKKEG